MGSRERFHDQLVALILTGGDLTQSRSASGSGFESFCRRSTFDRV